MKMFGSGVFISGLVSVLTFYAALAWAGIGYVLDLYLHIEGGQIPKPKVSDSTRFAHLTLWRKTSPIVTLESRKKNKL